ncbi:MULTISPECIES: twin-arginine translocase TatA/TatE family subunit [Pseudomonadota]|uniref:Sec-independent protein translocase protein TatA n=2 Tax=Dickeya TaxID=204037 RepID=A0ABX8W0I8_9GAMM|nr:MULTISPECIES: twin-arginine translocase TatA/TatE family subunit [Pseudomonadota]MBP2846870.1 twin-arginine translocase TatA/TatE family subunit [Dickeya oryzae]MBP2851044.1 twin-arginine translocase TatA/TatE family subunit [Dickeya oryzae]MBP2858458.1 twin-arginine translocase TatA/TatE family subunit [Dickeya oryzae]MCA6991911.1 twin-arginine translocase TatA/TatE family subunit [Dickeya oryzae]MCA6995220.1 twin-arginine translocase TatA/TatE family subunit [Dickeya oryzae]
MGGISLPSLLLIAVIVVLLFGTGKLKSLGSDLGASIKGFKKAMSDDKPAANDDKQQDADFATKSISEHKPQTSQEEKSHHKEQV